MITFWVLVALLILIALTILVVPLLKGKANYGRVAVISILIVLPVLSLILYFHWGDSKELGEFLWAKEHAVEIKQLRTELKDPEQVAEKLKEHLASDKNSAKGWYLLGRLYRSMGKHKEAADAFLSACKIKPRDVDLKMEYIEALYFSQKQNFDKKSENIVKSILREDPENERAISLLAMDAYLHDRHEQAIKYWEQLLQKYPPESQTAKDLLEAISKAR